MARLEPPASSVEGRVTSCRSGKTLPRQDEACSQPTMPSESSCNLYSSARVDPTTTPLAGCGETRASEVHYEIPLVSVWMVPAAGPVLAAGLAHPRAGSDHLAGPASIPTSSDHGAWGVRPGPRNIHAPGSPAGSQGLRAATASPGPSAGLTAIDSK